MKIFFVASSFPNTNAPMRGIFNFRFIKQMNELGEDVFVVFFRMWRPGKKLINTYYYEGILVTEVFLPLIPYSNYYFMRINNFICKIFGWKLFKKQLNESDVLHSVYLTSNGVIGGYWAKKSGIPHISQAIGSDVNSDLKKIIRKSGIQWLKNIDGIITNSKDLEKSLKTLFNYFPPIQTIYRGIEINAVDLVKQAERLQREGATFLYLGGLELNKTLEFGINTKGGITLMEAWKEAENDLYRMNAKLYFGGPDSDRSLFKQWERTLQHPEKIELIGKIDPVDVNKYLHKSTISIIPSMEEGLPNFLMESAANKRAAIGSTAGGIPEVIINGETGFIFEKGSVGQLAALLIKTAGDANGNLQMGVAAFNHVQANFNSNDYSKNIICFYKKIKERCAE